MNNGKPVDGIRFDLGELYAGQDPLKDKLAEANFFREKMNETKDDDCALEFKHYFSACLLRFKTKHKQRK